MESGLGLFLIVFVSGVCLAVLLTLLSSLFSVIVKRTADFSEERHGRSVLLGFLNTILLMALASVLVMIGENIRFPLFMVLGGIALIPLGMGLVLGLSGAALMVGRGIKPKLKSWPKVLWGSGAIILASFTPYLGWFVFLPYILFRGFGGFVMAVSAIRRERKELKMAVEEDD